MNRATALLLPFLAVAVASANAQGTPNQRSTSDSCQAGGRPVVLIDNAHENSQRSNFRGLMELLEGDGFCVRQLTAAITREALVTASILVISNPGGWEGPEASLNASEVSAVTTWIKAGGSLVLLLDHAPAPANAVALTSALGVPRWHNGYAMVKVADRLVANIIFSRLEFLPPEAPAIGATAPGGGTGYQGADAVLGRHPINDGRSENERIQRVVTFGGSAFEPPPGAEAIMTLPLEAMSFQPPETPGARPSITTKTPHISVAAWLQGAVMKHGKGRVALFGESGFFSGGPAGDNRLFMLNLFRWLIDKR